MATDLQTDISALIGKCECATQLGTVSQTDQPNTIREETNTATYSGS